VVFYWAGQLLSVLKWQMLMRSQGAHVPFIECCRLYLIGMFCNLWLPTSIGGDAVRATLAARQCGGATVAVTSILVERLTGFLALLSIGLVALLTDLSTTSTRSAAGGLSPLSLMWRALVGVLLFVLLFWLSRAAAATLHQRSQQHRIIGKWAALHRALDGYAARGCRRSLTVVLLLSFLFQASQIVLNVALAYVVGLQVSIFVMWWLVPVLALASLLPVGIGGLGVREVAAISFLGATGATPQTIIAWSLLWQATVWLASLPGGVWWASRRQRAAAPVDQATPSELSRGAA
jgi:uncharacterized protein (TIRG00374 family)